ncbi:VanZ family protein [Guptibacillus hwajinpoensis]|uniref:VanZ family protein n=1 Tax=Guptibacillus hwajinpoensis TaxID=208199 RepID=UPI003CFDBC4E
MTQLWQAFGNLIPLFLIITIVVGVVGYFMSKKSNLAFKIIIINALVGLSIFGILLVTLYPKYYGTELPRVVNLVPFVGMYELIFHSVSISVPILNLGLNILLFVPFGFFLSWKISSFKKKLGSRIILSGFLFSFFIELTQYVVPMDRAADIDDLVLNTIGSTLGYIIWKIFNEHILYPKNAKTIQ